LAFLLAVPVAADELQYHEVSAMADIAIESGANTSTLDLQYVLTPGGIDRQDEVIPALRRFVRHPSFLYAAFHRRGATALTTDNGFAIGGALHLFDGVVYGKGEIGLQRTGVSYDDTREDRYDTMPFTLELGGRPIPLLSLGALYSGAPIIGSKGADGIIASQIITRDGSEHTFGGVVEFATPNDRFYLKLIGSFRRVDWTFTGPQPGDITVRGPGIQVKGVFQLSAEFGVGLFAMFRREHWVDDRVGDDDPALIGRDVDRQVKNLDIEAEVFYWHRAHVGFRFFAGGGFSDAPPLLGQIFTGFIKFGGGIVTRF
jgi:hypothetical protein